MKHHELGRSGKAMELPSWSSAGGGLIFDMRCFFYTKLDHRSAFLTRISNLRGPFNIIMFKLVYSRPCSERARSEIDCEIFFPEPTEQIREWKNEFRALVPPLLFPSRAASSRRVLLSYQQLAEGKQTFVLFVQQQAQYKKGWNDIVPSSSSQIRLHSTTTANPEKKTLCCYPHHLRH